MAHMTLMAESCNGFIYSRSPSQLAPSSADLREDFVLFVYFHFHSLCWWCALLLTRSSASALLHPQSSEYRTNKYSDFIYMVFQFTFFSRLFYFLFHFSRGVATTHHTTHLLAAANILLFGELSTAYGRTTSGNGRVGWQQISLQIQWKRRSSRVSFTTHWMRRYFNYSTCWRLFAFSGLVDITFFNIV